jgi:hypothetical protein
VLIVVSEGAFSGGRMPVRSISYHTTSHEKSPEIKKVTREVNQRNVPFFKSSENIYRRTFCVGLEGWNST